MRTMVLGAAGEEVMVRTLPGPRRGPHPSPAAAVTARSRARHLAAPRAGRAAAGLHHLLEALQVALDPAVGRADHVAQLLLDPLGDEVELDHDLGVAVVELVER